MSKFKVGDEVKRVKIGCGEKMEIGSVHVIKKIRGDALYFSDGKWNYMAEYYELVHSKYPNPPHVRADVIIEWAKGADIVWQRDYEKGTNAWRDCNDKQSPGWHVENIYKVKTTQSKLADIKTQVKIDKLLAKIGKLKLSLSNGSE